MPKLTKRVVDALEAKGGKDTFIWDDEIKGFGVRAKPSGVKSWILQYRNRHGHSRRLTLGSVGDLTPKQARDLAQDRKSEVRKGDDPADQKAQDRSSKTIEELCKDYLTWLKNRQQKPVKPSTLINEGSRIGSHIVPLLGKKAAKSFDTVEAVEDFFQAVAGGKTAKERKKGQIGGIVTGGVPAAHRVTDTLSSIFEYAKSKKIVTTNPVAFFVRERPKTMPPPFSLDAVKRLGKAIRELEDDGEPVVGTRAIRHLLLSGFRRMEALRLQWGQLDPGAHCARLEDTKTGPQIRALGQTTIDHLLSFKPRDAKAADYVFPGAGEAGHFVGLPKVWDRIAAKAKIEGVTIHGLRHWFSSAATELGYSDIVIGAIIGHAKKGVTGRYATAPDTLLVAAANRISQYLYDALEGRKTSNVVAISRPA